MIKLGKLEIAIFGSFPLFPFKYQLDRGLTGYRSLISDDMDDIPTVGDFFTYRNFLLK